MFNTPAGSSRSTGPLGLGAAAPVLQPQRPPQALPGTAAHRLSDCIAALDGVALQDPAKARAFLEGLAQGLAQDTETAQAVFNDLIAHDAHGLFADVFTAHHQFQEARYAADRQVFKSSLMLRLPVGWKTGAPAAMEQAFSRIRVDRLAILRPPASAESAKAEAPLSAKGASASEPVCSAIAAMLKFGTSELWLQGALDAPLVVADAIATSRHLKSIALEDPHLERPLDLTECHSHQRLIARGVVRSTSLTHVGLHQPELVMSLQLCLLAEPKLPKTWTELKLNFSGADETDTRAFMAHLDGFLKKFPNLVGLDIRPHDLDVEADRIRTTATTTTTATTATTTDPGGT
ncbi:hypothetical protein [Hydrogenophaga sp.]|uniref:hypothetical protein n=1 Tax=Hydrogenophaga sp. TaxID=1904254 RepID=UPI002720D2F1|nr:hypothetical protein [Hydrogenophaga sp.]MDO9434470.1 hypothetical protein [Hydrogenophaga sp.]